MDLLQSFYQAVRKIGHRERSYRVKILKLLLRRCHHNHSNLSVGLACEAETRCCECAARSARLLRCGASWRHITAVSISKRLSVHTCSSKDAVRKRLSVHTCSSKDVVRKGRLHLCFDKVRTGERVTMLFGNREQVNERLWCDMEQGSKNREKNVYEYESYPENIKQIGETGGARRIYIEDYVLTDIRKIFLEKQEESIIVFLGREGIKEAKDGLFLYGCIEVELDPETGALGDAQWDKLYEDIHKYFAGAKVLGWGLGVGMWNSKVDKQVRHIQEEQFGEMSRILFLADLSEKEEKVFFYEDGAFEELSGYYIYFAKNPQMQEYMLREQKEISGEADYEDEVTDAIRSTIRQKKTRQERMQMVAWSAGVILFFMVLMGANLLMKSLSKIQAMEESIQTLSGYVTAQEQNNREFVVSDALRDKETAEPQNTQSTEAPKQSANRQSTEEPQQSVDRQSTEAPKQSVDQQSAEESQQSVETSKHNVAVKPTATPAQEVKTQTAARQKATAQSGSKATTAPERSVAASVTGGSQMESYIVRKGDTLSQIVWRQYHSFDLLDRVKNTNRIKNSDEIYIGQCILLPEP